MGSISGAYHKVTLDVSQLVRKLLLLCVVNRTVNLVVVVVQTGDVCAGEFGDLSCGSADTAANIKDLHALLDANLVCKVVLMTGNGLVEGLADGETAEVERLAPSELVDVGGKVVVAAIGENMSAKMSRRLSWRSVGVLTALSMWRTRRFVPVMGSVVSS